MSATGPCAVAGGGWQQVSIPLASFFDDNSYHFGGNGVFDPFPESSGGNGRLVSVVLALVSNSGDDINFKTDRWMFTSESTSISGRVWHDANGNGLPDGGEPGWNGVDVDLLDSTGATLRTTTTAGDGDYRFAALPWGEYSVSIQDGDVAGRGLPDRPIPTAWEPRTLHPPCAAVPTRVSPRTSGTAARRTRPPRSWWRRAVPTWRSPTTSACNAPDHVLLYGDLGDFTAVTAADCSIGNSGSAISTPPAGDVWFLVAGSEAWRYSSVGQSSAGERTLSGVESECPSLTEQDLSATCP